MVRGVLRSEERKWRLQGTAVMAAPGRRGKRVRGEIRTRGPTLKPTVKQISFGEDRNPFGSARTIAKVLKEKRRDERTEGQVRGKAPEAA